MAITTITLCW